MKKTAILKARVSSCKARFVSMMICFSLIVGIISSSNLVYAYEKAFEFNAQTAFDIMSNAHGWDMNMVRNPPDPSATSWRAKYGSDIVTWNDDNQVQAFFDGCYGTTASFTWDLENGFTMPTGSGSDIVARAQSQADLPEYQRVEQPSGTNRVGYVDWYLGGSPGDYSAWHWCCIFVMFCAEGLGPEYAERGQNKLFAWTGSCSVQHDYMIYDKGYYNFSVSSAWSNREQVMPGDILFFRDYEHGGWGHIGIVEEVGPNNSYIQTIEGNTSGYFNYEQPGHKPEGVWRQRYTRTSDYAAMQGGVIVRPPYPTLEEAEEGEAG